MIFDLETEIKKISIRLIEILTQLQILSQTPAQRLNKKYLSSDEVCKILKISERTLAKMRSEGSIKFRKIRRKILYPAEALHQFIEQNFD